MRAVRLHAVVDKQRRLIIEVPDEVAEGPIELILLGLELARPTGGLAAHLDFVMTLPAGQDQARLDAAIEAERAAWEE
jgi:hypothetical protein